MAYGFNSDKSKVDVYSQDQIDTKFSDKTEIDVLYFKLQEDRNLDVSIQRTATQLSFYLLSSEYSTTLRRKFRSSNYSFVVAGVRLAEQSGSRIGDVSGVTLDSFYFSDSNQNPVLNVTAWTSNATAATSIKISASVSYVKVLAIPNSRITDPLA